MLVLEVWKGEELVIEVRNRLGDEDLEHCGFRSYIIEEGVDGGVGGVFRLDDKIYFAPAPYGYRIVDESAFDDLKEALMAVSDEMSLITRTAKKAAGLPPEE